MADDAETIKLVMQVDTAQVAAAVKPVDALDAAGEKVAATFTDAAGRLRDASGRFVKVGSDAWNAAKGIDGATAAAAKNADAVEMASVRTSSVITTGMSRSGIAAGAFGYKLQVIGQGLDDLQYVGEMGLRPIINNLMQLSPVVGIAAIGVNLLWNNWDKIAGLWREGHTETEAERMGRLEKATNRTAAETKELNRHKQHQADIEKVLATQSKDQKASGSTIGAATGLVGGEQAIKDLTAALTEQGGLVGKDSRPEHVEAVKASMRKRAEDLLASASGGSIPAADAVRGALGGTNAGRASATGKALEFGDAEERRKVLEKIDRESEEREKARTDAIARVEDDKLRERLDFEKRQKEFMADSLAARRIAEIEKEAALQKQFAEDMVARQVQLHRQAAAASNAEMGRLGQAAGIANPIDRMMMQARMNPNARHGPAPKVWAEMTQAERRETTASAALKRFNDWKDPGRAGKPKTWADMSPEERRQVEASMTPEELADGKTPQKKALDAHNAAMKPKTLEEQRDEQAKRNAADDERMKGTVARTLMRNGVTRDPNFAAAMADQAVRDRRKAMDGATGDKSSAEIDLKKALEENTETLKELNRKGITGVIGR